MFNLFKSKPILKFNSRWAYRYSLTSLPGIDRCPHSRGRLRLTRALQDWRHWDYHYTTCHPACLGQYAWKIVSTKTWQYWNCKKKCEFLSNSCGYNGRSVRAAFQSHDLLTLKDNHVLKCLISIYNVFYTFRSGCGLHSSFCSIRNGIYFIIRTSTSMWN
jgi:hypothetical protein